MTLDEEIEWWKAQAEAAERQETTMLAWGIHTGLRIARDHLRDQPASEQGGYTSAQK